MRQRIELTGTNRSFGLIALIFNARLRVIAWKTQLASLSVLGRPGGISGEPVPDPIPNSAVKLPSANGTKSQDLEE